MTSVGMDQSAPNSRYQHLYAIIRIDYFQFEKTEEPPAYCTTGDPAQYVTAKSVFIDHAAAKAEVERLNGLRNGVDCRYFIQTTRLIDGVAVERASDRD